MESGREHVAGDIDLARSDNPEVAKAAPNPQPRPETRMERMARLAASPLITEAPPLTEWQRDRLAVLLNPGPRET